MLTDAIVPPTPITHVAVALNDDCIPDPGLTSNSFIIPPCGRSWVAAAIFPVGT